MTEIPLTILGDASLHPSVKVVMAALYSFCPWSQAHDPFVYPTVEQLAARAGMSRSAVVRALASARKTGLAQRANDGRLGFKLPPHPRAERSHATNAGDITQKSQAHGWAQLGPRVGTNRPTDGPVHGRRASQERPTHGPPYTIGTLIKEQPPSTPAAEDDASMNHDNYSTQRATLADSGPEPEPTPDEPWSVELETELFALQNAAYRSTGTRLGKTDLQDVVLTPGIRQAIQARMLGGYTADMLRRAMRARGRVGGARDFQLLGSMKVWAGWALEHALGIADDEVAQKPGDPTGRSRSEPRPLSEGPLIVRCANDDADEPCTRLDEATRARGAEMLEDIIG